MISGISAGVQGELVRDGSDGAHVRCHVLAHPAVSTGRAAHQAAPLVGERDRQAVDLRLADEGRPVLGRQQPLQAGSPGEDLLEGGDLVEAHHGRAVRHGREQRRGARSRPTASASPPSTSSGCCCLERRQLVLEGVVVGVGDVGGVLEVVLRVVALDEGPQLGDPGLDARLARRLSSLLTPVMVGRRPSPVCLSVQVADPRADDFVAHVERDRLARRDPTLGPTDDSARRSR